MAPAKFNNQSDRPGDSQSNPLALIVVAAGLICIAWGICTDADNRFISDAPKQNADRYEHWDAGFTSEDRGDGVFLHFDGFTDDARAYYIIFYFRAVYTLYPETVLVGDPALVINNIWHVAAANIPRGDDWLLRHGVHSVLTISLAEEMIDNQRTASINLLRRRIDAGDSPTH